MLASGLRQQTPQGGTPTSVTSGHREGPDWPGGRGHTWPCHPLPRSPDIPKPTHVCSAGEQGPGGRVTKTRDPDASTGRERVPGPRGHGLGSREGCPPQILTPPVPMVSAGPGGRTQRGGPQTQTAPGDRLWCRLSCPRPASRSSPRSHEVPTQAEQSSRQACPAVTPQALDGASQRRRRKRVRTAKVSGQWPLGRSPQKPCEGTGALASAVPGDFPGFASASAMSRGHHFPPLSSPHTGCDSGDPPPGHRVASTGAGPLVNCPIQ